MTIMRSYDDICSDASNASVECVNPGFDFRNYGRLRFLPAAAGILATNVVNSVIRILSVCLVYARDLQVHLVTPQKIKSCPSTMVLPRRTLHGMATNR
jgi:hypothetical protein